MIFGVLIFYFQGLQPLILREYANNTHLQIKALTQEFKSQINTLAEMETLIASSFSYDPLVSCLQTETYETAQSDADSLSRSRINLLPKTSLKDLDNIGIFYESGIRSEYQKTYAIYDTGITELQPYIDNIVTAPEYLSYRNKWIKTCQNVQSSTATRSVILTSCEELKAETEIFKSSNAWQSLDESIKEELNKNTQICQDFENQFLLINTFRDDWLKTYDLIMNYQPNFNQMNILVNGQFSAFQIKAQESTLKINEIYNSKTGFTNIWYLLDWEK